MDTSDYDSGVKNVSKSGNSLASKLKSGLATAGKAAAAGIAAIGTAAVACVAALNGIAEATEEYRVAMGKLNTAFDAAGFSADAAQEAYSGFYAILGDTDTATEASQLLAKLAESEEDVSTWTNIAAGVFGTFGDSLPIEGLIEASNETAKVGQVTGVLADALNWAGISEDAFNEQLAACSNESERNRLIMETLAGTYDDAADAYYENNAALIQSRENQERLNKVLAGIGTAVENAKNSIVSTFLPAIEDAGGKVEEFVTRLSNAFSKDGLSGLLSAGSEIIVELVSGIVAGLPQIISSAVQIIQTILEGIRQNLPVITQGAVEALTAFVNGLVELLPDLLQTGIELIVNLANGIAEALPELIPVAVEAILQFAETLIDNIDTIIDAAINLVTALADGIVDAIPILVEKAPELIAKLVEGIIRNLPKILEAAVRIIAELAIGLGDGFDQLYNNMITWVDEKVIQPIKNKIQDFIDIGKDIVRGIWDGITAMGEWISEKVTGFFSGIVDGVEGLLGIESPPKVFAGIGENMALGLGKGWDNEFSRIRSDIEGGMNFGTANVDFASSGLGVAASGMVNGISSAVSSNSYGGSITINLMLPDGTKFATWQLPHLIQAGRAAGTPIANPQVG